MIDEDNKIWSLFPLCEMSLPSLVVLNNITASSYALKIFIQLKSRVKSFILKIKVKKPKSKVFFIFFKSINYVQCNKNLSHTSNLFWITVANISRRSVIKIYVDSLTIIHSRKWIIPFLFIFNQNSFSNTWGYAKKNMISEFFFIMIWFMCPIHYDIEKPLI